MTDLPPIQFGTSGWRGLIAKDFTFDRVRLATQGIADYLKAERRKKTSPLAARKPTIVLGHDARFLGRDFALAAAEVLEANGFTPLLCATPSGTRTAKRRWRPWLMCTPYTRATPPKRYATGMSFTLASFTSTLGFGAVANWPAQRLRLACAPPAWPGPK